MNCFNVRELQSLLRNKFFHEITPSVIFTKGDASSNLNLLLNHLSVKSPSDVKLDNHSHLNSIFFNPVNGNNASSFFYTFNPFNYTSTFLTSLSFDSLKSFFAAIYTLTPSTEALSIFFRSLLLALNPTYLLSSLSLFSKPNLSNYFKSQTPSYFNFQSSQGSTSQYSEVSSFFLNSLNLTNHSATEPNEVSFFANEGSSSRFINLSNPNFVYKIKIGNYLPDALYNTNFSYLSNTINTKSLLGLQANWFNSANFSDLLGSNLSSFPTNPSKVESFDNNKINTLDFMLVESLDTFSLKNNKSSNDSAIKNLFFSQSKQTRVIND